MDDQAQVVDGELEETPTENTEEVSTEETPSSDGSKAMILMNMEEMIKNHLASIDRLDSEYRKQKEMLDDIFNNDSTYKAHSEAAKEANKVKAGTKAQIMKQQQVADLAAKVKQMKSEMSELQASLSDYLQQFNQLSGLNEIEDETGEVRVIVYAAKLTRKGPGQ